MRYKARFASTLLSIVFALGVMGFAVYAAVTQMLVVTNTVNFVSNHVLATISGTVTGALEGTFADYLETITNPNTTELETWAIGEEMMFDDEKEPILITLTIQNNSPERFFTIELSQTAHTSFYGQPLGTTNINRSVDYSVTLSNGSPISNVRYLDGASITVDPTATATIVMTISIANRGKSILGFVNNFTATLRNKGEVTPGTENFVFNPVSRTLVVPEGSTLTYENLPDMEVSGLPAYYGLFTEATYENYVTLPYSGPLTVLYTKFGIGDDLEYVYNGGNTTEYVASGNTISAGLVEIPEKYNLVPITVIAHREDGNAGFQNNSNVTGVFIPQTVLKIGTETFNNCFMLSQIFGANSVSIVEYNAFNGTLWLDNQLDGTVYIGTVAYLYK